VAPHATGPLRQCYHALGQIGTQGQDPRRPRLVAQKTVARAGYEPLLPTPGTSLRFASSAHARVRAEPGGAEKNNGRAPHAFLGGVAITTKRTVLGCQAHGNSAAHPARLPRSQTIKNLLEDSNVNF